MNLKGWLKNRSLVWLLVALAAVAALMLGGGASPSAESRMEKRMAEVLGSISGAGKVQVALFYTDQEETQRPTGAVVVAQGADDFAVRLELIRAVRTLLGLPEAAVDVFAMEE